MKAMIPYLTFNGNCREAMHFYKECIGGKLLFQTIEESPLSVQLPIKMKKCVLQATLTIGNVIIMATDMTPENGLVKGNAVSLLIDCTKEEEIYSCYNKLLVGGSENHPLENTFCGAIFGNLTDKYGNHWLLNYNKINKETNQKK
ncbi:VOC family protein [Flavobacterium faecale]|uniref:VOC family protein n=1 Tax=Flavobacterium faecale TaxID=1355330 RepID=UPI003AAB4CCE